MYTTVSYVVPLPVLDIKLKIVSRSWNRRMRRRIPTPADSAANASPLRSPVLYCTVNNFSVAELKPTFKGGSGFTQKCKKTQVNWQRVPISDILQVFCNQNFWYLF